MQQIFLSGEQASPTPGVLEITPPAGPHNVKQFTRGGLSPPLISFKADLLRFFVFEKFLVMILFFGNYKVKYLIINLLKTNHKIQIKTISVYVGSNSHYQYWYSAYIWFLFWLFPSIDFLY